MLLFVAWILWMYACTTEVALSEARKGIPEGERKGVSIFPVLPIFPLVFWGIALFIDQFARPWGTNLVAGFHLALSLGWLVSKKANALKGSLTLDELYKLIDMVNKNKPITIKTEPIK